MLRDWHSNDVFGALRSRGWNGPTSLEYPNEWYYVGEAHCFQRGSSILKLYFVADYGTGFEGAETIESITAQMDDNTKVVELWLNRTRNAKWKASLVEWADLVSGEGDRKLLQSERMDKTIRKYTSLAQLHDVKAEEYRYWQSRPICERVEAVSQLTREAYEMKGATPDVFRLQRTLVHFERSRR